MKAFLDGTWPLPDPKFVNTTDALATLEWFGGAGSAPFVAIDTEFNPSTNFLHLVGLGYPEGAKILQFAHREASWQSRETFGSALKQLVGKTTVIFQNAVADIPIIEKAYGITYKDYLKIEDTMLAHAVLWSDWPHTLEFLASIYGRHNKFKHLASTNPEVYNAGDVVDTISTWQGIDKEFKSDGISRKVYQTQSLNLIPIIIRAQKHGLQVNPKRIQTSLFEMADAKAWAINTSQLYAGWPINIGSDDQLKYELYNREKLPVQFVPKSKPPKSTIDADAIAALRALVGPFFDTEEEAKQGLSVSMALERIKMGANPLLECRVVYAAAQQAISHYILPCCEVDNEGGVRGIKDRVYPRYLAHAQASGRWSTVDPPMAQVPKSLQDIVQPDEGEKWIEWDWDQIELRILAALSNDEIYKEAFQKGWDIHTLNTCDIFGWSYPADRVNPHTSKVDESWRVTKGWLGKDDPRRRFGKVFIFRLNYGGEAKTATDIPGVKQLGLDAKGLVLGSQNYLKRHPWIKQYWDSITVKGIQNREVRTFMGRRRRLLTDSKSGMKRLIYNHPMQGGVSDVFNTTMVKVAKRYPELRFVYGVHDNQKWAVKEDDYYLMYQNLFEIVHEPWHINGEKVLLPATFKKG